MTFADLLDQAVYDAGDDSGEYRLRALHWLNLARAYVADRGTWSAAMDPEATLTTDEDTTTGLYTIGSYDHISGDYLFDETSNNVVRHESLSQQNAIDPDKSTTAAPNWWGDAGADSNGNRQIYLWPVPDSAYVLRFAAYRTLTDISNEALSTDPFFGAITPWGPTFSSGIRYYHDLNSNEDASQILLQRQTFDFFIKQRKKNNELSPGATLRLGIVRTQAPMVSGRFSPAHFNNRGT